MEAKQREDMHVVCDVDFCENHKDWPIYRSSDPHCCTEEKYQDAYAILLLVGMSIGQAQVLYYLINFVLDNVDTYFNILIVLKQNLFAFLFVASYVSTIYAYQHLIYHNFFCRQNDLLCTVLPDEYNVVVNLYNTFATFMAVFVFIESCIMGIFLYCFFAYRYNTLMQVMDIENTLFFFKDDLNNTVSVDANKKHVDVKFTLNKTFNIKDFVHKWIRMNDNDDAFDEYIKQNTLSILYRMQNAIDTLPRESLTDTSVVTIEGERPNDETKSKKDGEFDKSIFEKVIRTYHQNNKTEKMWQLLTKGGAYDKMCYDSVESLIYDLYFLRKDIAVSIKTDLKITRYLCYYAKLMLYPACFIATSRIWGYNNAFGEGVDLFKTYVLGLSFILQRILPNLQFLSVMLKDRPINIGETVRTRGDYYVLKNIKILYSVLEGSDTLYVDNTTLLDGSLVNVSRMNVSDSFQLCVPLHTPRDKINEQVCLDIINSYIKEYPRDIKENSFRCGWCNVNEGNKVISFHWRYKFRIYNRGRVTWTRTRIMNYITEELSQILGDNYFEFALANGGAFNGKYQDT